MAGLNSICHAMCRRASTASGCATQGVNVALDLAGLQHYGGRANQNRSNGEYYITATGTT